jgi:threonine 3-dehydrogenase
VAMLGIPSEPIAIDWNKVIFKGLFIKGVYGREMFETWYKMASLLQAGMNITPVITHRFRPEELEEAFGVMNEGKCGKAVFDWSV